MARARSELSAKETKILWGFGVICAQPDCDQWLVEEPTDAASAAVVGEAAHIVGHSLGGPRRNASYPDDKLDSAENRVLLCPTHHTIVDKQPGEYTIEQLRAWKVEQVVSTRQVLGAESQAVNFEELSRLTRALLASPGDFSEAATPPTRPLEKMERNSLSTETAELLNIGYLRSPDVQEFIARTEEVEPGFAKRLVSGFHNEYERLVAEGLHGDQLFAALGNWSAQGASDARRSAAGIAVLTHLFTICDVFEP